MKTLILFLAMSRLGVFAQGVITTVAGSQWVFPDDGGKATSAALATPQGLAADSKGNVYIASQVLNMVLKLAPSGIITVVAGNGLQRFAGDGGPARAASLGPQAVAVDGAGNLYIADYFNHRVRKVDTKGVISTIAGNGNDVSLTRDDGPALSVALGSPISIAVDAGGTVYIGDALAVIRKVNPAGIISTIAGTSQQGGFSGDGGPASQALIGGPRGLTLDAAGNLYFADMGNNRVRRIDTKGVISTVAGNGSFGSGGDGGVAVAAQLGGPTDITLDAGGSLYIADAANQRIRRVSPNGIIATIAGRGQIGFGGDGGPALSASFANPYAIVLDPSGNLYVSDRDNHRVRRIDSGGTITTVAGAGEYLGDGGPATSARLSRVAAIAVAPAGNLYLADADDNRIRKVSAGGLVSTIAGTGVGGFGGDGGLAASALINSPQGVAVDAAGNLYIADTGNSRIRKVAADGTISTYAGTGNCCQAVTDGTPAISASINVGPSSLGLDGSGNLYFFSNALLRIFRVAPDGKIFNFAGNGQDGIAGDGGPALQAALGNKNVSGPQLAADPAGNVYLADYNNGVIRKIGVNGLINTIAKVPFIKGIAVDKAGAVYLASFGSNRVSRLNADGSVTAYAGTGFGFTGDGGPALSAAMAFPFGIAFDPTGNLFIADWANQRVREVLAGNAPAVVLSPAGLTFTAVAGTGVPLSQTLTVVNGGPGALNWSATASTTAGGNWLSVGSQTGVSQGGQPGIPVTIQVDPSKLAAGAYYGQIQVTSPGATNSPQFATVVLNVLAGGSSASLVQPGGLLFVVTAGGATPAPQGLTVSTQSAGTVRFVSTASFGNGQPWFTLAASSGTVSAGKPVTVSIQPAVAGFAPGSYNANITFAFDNGPAQNVNLLLVVTSSPSSKAEFTAAGCAPVRLLPLFTSLGSGFQTIAGWPSTIELQVVDDCGIPLTAGSVTASFSNGDPAFNLTSLRDGRWSGTWQAQRGAGTGVSVSISAQNPDGKLAGSTQVSGSLTVNNNPPPVVAAGGVLNAASYQLQAPMAPGALVAVFGSLLAQQPANAPALPLPVVLGGVSVSIAGKKLPLIYASPNQVNAVIPYDLPINATHQLIVQRGTALSTPEPLSVLSSQSGVFTRDLTGRGAAIVVNVAADGTQSLVGQDNPVQAYNALVIYCSGLGDVTPQEIAGQEAPLSPLSQTLDAVKVTIGGVDAPVFFAGLTPGFTGLYQVNAFVPTGVTPGDDVQLVITQAGRVSPPVSISVR